MNFHTIKPFKIKRSILFSIQLPSALLILSVSLLSTYQL